MIDRYPIYIWYLLLFDGNDWREENRSNCALSIENCYSNKINQLAYPTRSRGINRISAPCFKNTLPAVCCGRIPIPSSLIIAVVAGSTPNSSAANFSTAVNGVLSGTLSLFRIKKRKKPIHQNMYFPTSSRGRGRSRSMHNNVFNSHFERQFRIRRQCNFEGNFWFFGSHLHTRISWSINCSIGNVFLSR